VTDQYKVLMTDSETTNRASEYQLALRKPHTAHTMTPSATTRSPLAVATEIATEIPTEPIGSIPRSAALIAAMRAFDQGLLSRTAIDLL
jgi:hypothetical protein